MSHCLLWTSKEGGWKYLIWKPRPHPPSSFGICGFTKFSKIIPWETQSALIFLFLESSNKGIRKKSQIPCYFQVTWGNSVAARSAVFQVQESVCETREWQITGLVEGTRPCACSGGSVLGVHCSSWLSLFSKAWNQKCLGLPFSLDFGMLT